MRYFSTIIATIAVLAFAAPAFAGAVSSGGGAHGPGNSSAGQDALGDYLGDPGISQPNCLGDVISSRAPGGPKDPYSSTTENISFIFTLGLHVGETHTGEDCSKVFNDYYGNP
jgi:hypothetical protein